MRTFRWARAELLLPAGVFLSRIPFLGPGAGNDNDAWFLVNAARELSASGRYTTSRFPGYPVHEWLCSWVARAGGGPEAMNVVSALAGAVAVALFLRLLRRLGARDAWVTALAFGFAPAVSVASVSAMDYLLALAFVLAACEARLAGRPLMAGAWFGLAIGTRLTSLVLAPAVLLFPALPHAGAPVVPGTGDAPPKRGARGAWAGVALALVIAAVCYVPAQARYGWGFLRFVDPLGTGSSPLDFVTGYLKLDRLPFPPALVFGQATALLWGVPGALLLAAAAVAALVRLRARRAAAPFPRAVTLTSRSVTLTSRSVTLASRSVTLASLAAIVAELVLYLRLPHDEGYLIPAVPFALLLSAGFTPAPWHRAACVAVALSSFTFGVEPEPPKKGVAPDSRSALALSFPAGSHRVWLEPLRGPLELDHDKRLAARRIANEVIRAFPAPPADTLVLAGVVCAELTARLPQERERPWYTDYLLEPDLRATVAAGRTVWLLPGVRERVITVAGYDPFEAGARPWPGAAH